MTMLRIPLQTFPLAAFATLRRAPRQAAALLLAIVLWLGAGGAAPAASELGRLPPTPLGLHMASLVESAGPLTLDEARVRLAADEFTTGTAEVLRFGIGSAPVWLHLPVRNTETVPAERRLSIESSWLDRIDIHVLHGDKEIVRRSVGDAVPGSLPEPGLGYVVDLVLPPGDSALLVRIATPDTLVVPLRLLDRAQGESFQRQQDFTYAALYGFLLALIGYNAMLWFGLRERSFLDYTLYVGSFLLLNLCYSGNGYIWLWRGNMLVQQYCIPIMMVISGCFGLRFADGFLGLREHAPAAHRFVNRLIAAGLAIQAVCVLLLRQQDAVHFGFVFILAFSLVMVGLGLLTVRNGRIAGRYYLAAALTAMVAIAVTALAAWFGLPYSQLTFHAAGWGIAAEGILLALALAYRMREHQRARLQAEQLARIDPLTGLFNRRAFRENALPVWSTALRGGRPLAVIALDIDHFKAINDSHGHDVGDRVITTVARLLKDSSRSGDIVARWGGEEFIVLLPETDGERAAALAERLRKDIARLGFRAGQGPAAITASFGVAARNGHESLDDLICAADHRLYAAKAGGRNRVELFSGAAG